MPIYEFKCLKCNELVEILFKSQEDPVDRTCPRCRSGDLERVLSTTRYAFGSGTSKSTGVSSQTRNCPGGSCTTYDIPGPTR